MKRITLFITLFIFVACSTKPSVIVTQEDAKFNTPFINASETSQLDFGLTKDEVLDMLGEPLFVSEGIGATKTITWVYEVRTIEVKYEESEYLNNEAYIYIDSKHISSILEVEDTDILEEDVARLIEEYLDLTLRELGIS